MGVQDAAGMGLVAVQRAVQGRSSDIWRIRARQARRIVGIDPQQLTGPDPREMPTVGVDQEFSAIRRQRYAEVIGNRFVQPQPRGPAKGASQLPAQPYLRG